MGLEAACTAEYLGQTSAGKAHLEPAELLFRGEFQLKIPVKEVERVEAVRGRLHVHWAGGQAALELGAAAETWMLKIRYPKGRLDKLGVKAGMKVAALGIDDEDFFAELAGRDVKIAKNKPGKDAAIIFYGVADHAALERLTALRQSLDTKGAIWTIYRKGQKDLTQAHVMAAGKAAGLVDVKVVSFSETHSSLKWVIPVSERKP